MAKGQNKSKVQPYYNRQAIKHWPVSERPREKLLHLGPEELSDGELLAILLRIGSTGQSSEDLGRQLMSQFKGISGIDRAHTEELLDEENRLIFLFEPRNRNDKVPFDLTTFEYVPVSQAAEIRNKVRNEIIAILRDAGAPI